MEIERKNNCSMLSKERRTIVARIETKHPQRKRKIFVKEQNHLNRDCTRKCECACDERERKKREPERESHQRSKARPYKPLKGKKKEIKSAEKI